MNKIYLATAPTVSMRRAVCYGKSIRDVSLAQMAMIAGLPKAPSRFNPWPTRARQRAPRLDPGRMYKLGKIDEPAYQAALASSLNASYTCRRPK